MNYSLFGSYEDQQTDLMLDQQTNEPSPRYLQGQAEKLRQQNIIKQKALDKASALIDLLNLELAVSKKAFQEAIQELKHELKLYEEREYKFRQQIKTLQSEVGEKKAGAKINQQRGVELVPKRGFRSESKLQENQPRSGNKLLRKGNSSHNSPSKVNPSNSGQKKKQEGKEFTMEYMKQFLSEYINQDYEQTNLINNMVQRETVACSRRMEAMMGYKEGVEMLQGRQEEESQQVDGKDVEILKEIVQDQNEVISGLKEVVLQYKNIVHELFNERIPTSQFIQGLDQGLLTLKNMNRTLPQKLRQLQSRHIASLQKAPRLPPPPQPDHTSFQTLNSNIKQALRMGENTTQKDIVLVVQNLKSKDQRLAIENRELIEIIEGLLKYIQL